MARRNDPNDDAGLRKKRAQEQEQEQDQEKEGKSSEKEGLSQQNQYGNHAIAGMLGLGGSAPGGAGLAMEPSLRAGEKSGEQESEIQYGGDDDDDDTPVTIEDLTRSWNPRTKKSDDKLRFIDSMPYDDLPTEDEAFIDAVRDHKVEISLPKSFSLDGLLEPSSTVMAASLSLWCHSIRKWAPHSLVHRTIGHMISPSAPFLQDDQSRVLHSRARCAAIGTWQLLMSPILTVPNPLANATLIDYCMELDGRDFRLHNILKTMADREAKIPKAAQIIEAHISVQEGRIQPITVSAGPSACITRSLQQILAFMDPVRFVPDLSVVETALEEEDDDPLGIDALLQAHTGQAPSVESKLYQRGLQGAEKMAQVTTETRVRLAAACILVAEVSSLWSRGAPTLTLHHIATEVDRRSDEVLRLLVEIAQAAKEKKVAPRGIQNGLNRAATSIRTLRAQILDVLCQIIGAILPSPPDFPPLSPPPNTPLEDAIRDGLPLTALDWVQSEPESFEQQATLCFLRGIGGTSPKALFPELTTLLEHSKSVPENQRCLHGILEICFGICALRTGNFKAALASSDRQIRTGIARKNGTFIAQATLLASEALYQQGRIETLQTTRLDMARVCWNLGARGPLTLIARWQPPEQ